MMKSQSGGDIDWLIDVLIDQVKAVLPVGNVMQSLLSASLKPPKRHSYAYQFK